MAEMFRDDARGLMTAATGPPPSSSTVFANNRWRILVGNRRRATSTGSCRESPGRGLRAALSCSGSQSEGGFGGIGSIGI